MAVLCKLITKVCLTYCIDEFDGCRIGPSEMSEEMCSLSAASTSTRLISGESWSLSDFFLKVRKHYKKHCNNLMQSGKKTPRKIFTIKVFF